MAVSPLSSPRRILPVSLAALAALAILIGLGLWQIQRLDWKRQLIVTLQSRLSAPPVTLCAVARRVAENRIDTERTDWLRVRASGCFIGDRSLYLYATLNGVAGWHVVSAFKADQGCGVLVDRGFIPDAIRRTKKDIARPAPAPLALTGHIRTHSRGQGVFTPDNQAEANRWYWWDIPAMAAEFDLGRDSLATAFVVVAEPSGGNAADRPQWPRALNPMPELPNHHLQYALTWFGLALCLLCIYTIFIVKRLRGR
ncbi:MAG: SURF1 family protein [Hyphomicrobiales bacterium]